MGDGAKILCTAIVCVSLIIIMALASDVGIARAKAGFEIAKLKCEATP